MLNSLHPFFDPKGVAIVGVSKHPEKLGYGLARNLLLSDYQGGIHFVGLRGGELFDRPIYSKLAEVPAPVDLVILLIPAQFVPDALVECANRGINNVIIGSGGFGEMGPEGHQLEQDCLQIAAAHNLRLMGPNCIGLLDTHLPIDTTFLPPPGPTPGSVAFISHSGAICAAVIDWARGQGFGLSRLVSLGNQIDVNETDVLAPVISDSYTKVVTLYLEGVTDGRKFVREALAASQQKPVIALKVGRYESGRAAVASHTGALAGEEHAYDAAFRRAGVLRANTSEEMFDWARALAWMPLPGGQRVAVLTNAGGPGVTASDALEAEGLELAELSSHTVEVLQKLLPAAASLNNPVDMLAGASPHQYAYSLKALLEDPGVDSVMVILPPPPTYTAAGVANAMIPIIQTASKPVVVALMGERLIQEAVERLRAAQIPEYRFPERAASALSILTKRVAALERCKSSELHFQDADTKIVADLIAADQAVAGEFLSPVTAQEILQAYNIPVLPLNLVDNVDDLRVAANEIGYPLVMKIASDDISHKTDVGGVQVGLKTEDEVVAVYQEMIKEVSEKAPNAKLEGVYIQKMIAGGRELIIGSVQDAQFGPLVMFGKGGVEVEQEQDVSFALAPVTNDDLDFLISSTSAGQGLAAYRNRQQLDEAAVRETIGRLAQLANDFPELQELEINPFVVFSDGQGGVALDIRILCGDIAKNKKIAP